MNGIAANNKSMYNIYGISLAFSTKNGPHKNEKQLPKDPAIPIHPVANFRSFCGNQTTLNLEGTLIIITPAIAFNICPMCKNISVCQKELFMI